MSDETQRPHSHEEAGDEVEGHGHHKHAANAEASDEATERDDDEVEAHGHHKLGKHKLQ